jgi:hypothetical protein
MDTDFPSMPSSTLFADSNDPDDSDSESEAMDVTEAEAVRRVREELRGRRFGLKRLVRLLHIGEPVAHVMAILGKK